MNDNVTAPPTAVEQAVATLLIEDCAQIYNACTYLSNVDKETGDPKFLVPFDAAYALSKSMDAVESIFRAMGKVDKQRQKKIKSAEFTLKMKLAEAKKLEKADDRNNAIQAANDAYDAAVEQAEEEWLQFLAKPAEPTPKLHKVKRSELGKDLKIPANVLKWLKHVIVED